MGCLLGLTHMNNLSCLKFDLNESAVAFGAIVLLLEELVLW